MSRRIYMDNAATSFPKPPCVHEAMVHYARSVGASPGRGAYAEARLAGRLMNECRTRIARLIGAHPNRPEQVIFTLNTTDALNLAIHGMVGRGDHIITTWLDHNSVLRPCRALTESGVATCTRLPCDSATGLVDPDDLRRAIQPNTRLIAVVHGSNVAGTLQPIRALGAIAREHDIPFLIDAAQTLGHVPIDVEADMIDLLAFPGHKGLLGPLGTGGLYIRPGVEQRINPIRQGGTGSRSEEDVHPLEMPDRFEAGSHNALGIIALSQAVHWILDRGVTSLYQHERELSQLMLARLTEPSAMPGLQLYGPRNMADRCGVFAVRIDGFDDPQKLSDLLEARYGILTRSGVHCAPLAHRTFGTLVSGGMTRFSFGPFLTARDVTYACDALAEICADAAQSQFSRRSVNLARR